MSAALTERLLAAQDRDADLRLLKDALSVESVTGNETPFARFLEQQMAALGLATGAGAFLPGRENTWATTAGAEGPNLMILGHTDTVHVRGWEAHWDAQCPNDPRRDPFGGVEREGQIWGRGASDLKGGICTAIAAMRLLRRAGVNLQGRVTLAFIGDEESGEPGSGVSAGAKDLVQRVRAGEIAKPDFALYVEPTGLDVYTAQIGFFIAELTLTGKTAYFGTPELGVDALKATHAVLSALWAHEAELAAGPKHDLVGASSLLVTGVEGGGFIAVPGQCKLSLIRKLRPGEDLDDAIARFEAVLGQVDLAAGLSLTIDYPAGRDHPKGGSAVEIPRDAAPAQLLAECVRQSWSEAGRIGGAPYWSEMPFLTEMIGCPAVYCAPGDIAVAHTYEERIASDEYLAAIRAFALFIARYCGSPDI
ncbi:M20 family metallopeptidase [Tritonibacter horizontis]|uniref:Carboxypeptidase G2 n=1 Tax=Tritonibacter horizontis TaxID=1768241 RepID=A0A132BU35_9RHOB|nr:M20/M25/M40 family metallo-hydrolase [Tritonibacter horizontis]KUP91572.1 carboxypeptidase G2 precursor [Tritonibacter horizontis]